MTAPLILFEPAQVRAAWAEIRPMLEAIRADCEEPWLAEDVFTALLDRRAFLWAPGPPAEGFIIVQLQDLDWGRRLFVWVTANVSEVSTREYWPQVQKIAADHRCQWIRFESPREGWARALPQAKVRFIYEFDTGV